MMRPQAPANRARLEQLTQLFGKMVHGWWRERLPSDVTYAVIVNAGEPAEGTAFSTCVSNVQRESRAQLFREYAATLEAGIERRPGQPLADLVPVRFTCELIAEPDDDGDQPLQIYADGQPCGILMMAQEKVASFVSVLHREPELGAHPPGTH